MFPKNPNTDKGEDLEKVKVKSLDEIIRERKQKVLEAQRSDTASETCKENGESDSACTSVTRSGCQVRLFPLTIPIKALPSRPKQMARRGRGKTIVSSHSRPRVNSGSSDSAMETENSKPSIDNTVLDGSIKRELKREENISFEVDEEALLMSESEDGGDNIESSSLSGTSEVDFSDVPLGGSHKEDILDEVLSLHPDDDSMFDDMEDDAEKSGTKRLSGRHSTSKRHSREPSDARELIQARQSKPSEPLKIKSEVDKSKEEEVKEESRNRTERGSKVKREPEWLRDQRSPGEKRFKIPKKPRNARVGFKGARGRGSYHKSQERSMSNDLPDFFQKEGYNTNVKLENLQKSATKLLSYLQEQITNNPIVKEGLSPLLFPSHPTAGLHGNPGILGPAPTSMLAIPGSTMGQRDSHEVPRVTRSGVHNSRVYHERNGPYCDPAHVRPVDLMERSSKPLPPHSLDRLRLERSLGIDHSKNLKQHGNSDVSFSGHSSPREGNSSGHSSPRDGMEVDKPATLKRQSSRQRETCSKVKKLEAKSKTPDCPEGYCWSQFQVGLCSFKFCRLKHFPTTEELQKYKETGVLETESADLPSCDEAVAPPQNAEEQQSGMFDPNIIQAAYNALAKKAAEELENKNLSNVWTILETMSQVDSSPHHVFLKLLQQTLVSCAELPSDPEEVAKVAGQVFELIGTVQSKHTRHDYTTFIHVLCCTGKITRAYEVLKVMKENGIVPTHDVFIDLIRASLEEPDLAFELLKEVKELKLFRTSICSELILLSCRGNTHMQRAWQLFQEMVDKQVPLSIDAASKLILTFISLKQTEKVFAVVKKCSTLPLMLPSETLSAMIWSCGTKEDYIELATAMVCKHAETCDPGLDAETWNCLLYGCCNPHYKIVDHARRLYLFMNTFSIPLLPKVFNVLLCFLGKANLIKEALEVFHVIRENPEVDSNPRAYFEGVAAIFSALQKEEDLDGICNVAEFMVEKGFQVNAITLMKIATKYEMEKLYERMFSFFKKFFKGNLNPPYAVLRKMLSCLEEWSENTSASLEVYKTMRQLYPRPPEDESSTDNCNRPPFDDQRYIHQPTIPCRFFAKGNCLKGDRCLYLHAQEASHPMPPIFTETVTCSSYEVTNSLNTHPALVRADSSGEPSNAPKHSPLSSRHQPPPSVDMSQPPPPAFAAPPQHLPHLGGAVTHTTTSHLFGPSPFVPSFTAHLPRPVVSAEAFTPAFGVGATSLPQPIASKQLEPPPQPPKAGPFVLMKNNQSGFGFSRIGDRLGPLNNPASSSESSPTSPFTLIPQQSSLFATSSLGTDIGPRPESLQPWATRHSVDVARSTGPALASRGTHSAPVFPTNSDQGRFKFPTSTNVQFYKARIEKVAEEAEWEDLADIYSEMKAKKVPIEREMLFLFYRAFLMTGAKDVGDAFPVFVSVLDQVVNEDNESDASAGEVFDTNEQTLIGQLGVALMQECFGLQEFQDGYNILHTLHQYSINYSQYSANFIPNLPPLSPSSVAMLAVEICLSIQGPQYDSALEVLRGCNYALPAIGTTLTIREANIRQSLFEKLAAYYLHRERTDEVEELLSNIGDKNLFGLIHLKKINNNLIRCYLKLGELEKALTISKQMETDNLMRDGDVLRALITKLAGADRITAAMELFAVGCSQGLYPPFPEGAALWKATIWSDFHKFEAQIYLERHMQLLSSYVKKQRQESEMPYSDKHFQALRITIIDVHQQKGMKQENVIEVLSSEFNPPLSCGISDKPGEVIVNPRSLRRWFLANPLSSRNIETSLFSNAAETPTHRDVVASNREQGMVIHVGVSNEPQAVSKAPEVLQAEVEEVKKKVRNTISGLLTRYLRDKRISSREHLRTYGRELADEYMRSNTIEEIQRNKRETRERIQNFVARHFDTPDVSG
ncbi:uncharacterized protein LOC5514676 isoform X1 [Nematostella vectensis]|uniref:uncharacterized protein LOC5514676 isoform X1 n=1 Tax=Nematostella vectensis TaxID=45351 RepID=UPI00207786AA|nr:uncharacterized protein LOC5514676 isoform X1 [Nematostella vectensis]